MLYFDIIGANKAYLLAAGFALYVDGQDTGYSKFIPITMNDARLYNNYSVPWYIKGPTT